MENERNPNNERKQRALQFAKEQTSIYFEERDLFRLLSYMQPSTSWIGTGEDEQVRNIHEAKEALARELEEQPALSCGGRAGRGRKDGPALE